MSAEDPHTRTTRYPGESEDEAREARRPRPLRTLAAVLGVAALLVAALVLVHQLQGGGSGGSGGGGGSQARGGDAASTASSRPSAESTRPTGQRPVKGTDPSTGIPIGYSRTDEGAESAATNYAVALGSSDMYNDASRHDIIGAIAASGSKTQLLSTTDRAWSFSRQQFALNPDGSAPSGLTFVCRSVPVGSRAVKLDTSAGAATIAVWSNGLIGLSGSGSTKPVTESWFTLTLNLTWQNNDWKLVSSSQKDGPAPVSADQRAATSKEIDNAVREFGGFTYAR
ncbi:hypothetical protein BIV57_13860 [Mangrovactinospora gilvigrisea]|uniref:Uncharacterized protein n=1 Tax=Mangrovactinospora gilvigrisea TaxID=1428644 RepID=A0A1J7CB80_9ACTN|nr:hypothetical protein [Mangrovactinospora gilvigrisea]OIV36898.1 hypothetical protein BIV57_13860 [Mangrovactinospora gilvigrisea]